MPSRREPAAYPSSALCPMLSSVAETAEYGASGDVRSAEVTAEVLAAAVCFVLGVGLTALSLRLAPQRSPGLAFLAGWPVFAVAGGVVLDQQPASRIGRVLTLLSLAPALDLGWAGARFGSVSSAHYIANAVSELAAVQVAAVALAIPVAVRPPKHRGCAIGLVVLAAAGALTVLLAQARVVHMSARGAGWALVVLGCAGLWTLVARAAWTDGRTSRRRVVWLLVGLALAGALVTVAWSLMSAELAYYVTGSVVAVTAMTVARLWLRDSFRPLDEAAFDVVLVVAAVGTAVLAAALVRIGAGLVRVPSPGTSAVFTALVTVVMAAPAALWVRRAATTHRYGSGVLSPTDVAVITADLHAKIEPRSLLDKAARMVAAASGSAGARIVLGEDAPVLSGHWILHPLDVGGDRSRRTARRVSPARGARAAPAEDCRPVTAHRGPRRARRRACGRSRARQAGRRP